MIVVLHGGPGAPGSADPVAALLPGALAPRQRGSGAEPLTVATHIADLRGVVSDRATLVGWSWGAMLALAFAAEFPQAPRRIVLVGCGTFDLATRAEFERRRTRYHFDADETLIPAVRFDRQAFEETWNDMLRLQSEGVYPAAFRAIASPVVMLHGVDDPHPGPMVRDSLLPFIPQLQYAEIPRCGHFPWAERHARDEFAALLRVAVL